MGTLRSLRVLLSFLVLAGANCAAGEISSEGEGKTLRILTGPPGGQWEALGGEFARVLNAAGIPAASEAGGGADNMRQVGMGLADIGFTLYSFLGAASAGVEELDSINMDGLSLLVNLYPQVMYIVTAGDFAERHSLRSLGDLLAIDGPVRFATLGRGTGSEFLFNMLLKNAYRTDYSALEEQGWRIGFNSYAEITRLFTDGKLDVCAYTAGPGTYLLPHLQEHGIDALLLPVEEEALDLMTHQFLTITYVIDGGQYLQMESEVTTLGDYSSLVVRADLPEELVRRVNAVLWENRAALAAVSEDIDHLSPRTAVAGRSRVHPGSRTFWKSLNLGTGGE